MECYKLKDTDVRKADLRDKEWINLNNVTGLGNTPDFSQIAPNAKKIELEHAEIRDIYFGPNVQEIYLWSIKGLKHIDFSQIAPNAKKIHLGDVFIEPKDIKCSLKVKEFAIDTQMVLKQAMDFSKIAPNATKITMMHYGLKDIPSINFGPVVSEISLEFTQNPFWAVKADFSKIAPNATKISLANSCNFGAIGWIWFGPKVQEIDMHNNHLPSCLNFETIAPNAKLINLENTHIPNRARISAPVTTKLLMGGTPGPTSFEIGKDVIKMYWDRQR